MNVQRPQGVNAADAASLRRAGWEMIELAARIERAARGEAEPGSDFPSLSERDLARAARAAYRARRERDRYFAAELFSEPAWDILLDLFIAGLDQRPMPVTAACRGAAVPEATALRWLGEIERSHGLVERVDHPSDRRVKLLQLSKKGERAMRAYLQGQFELLLASERFPLAMFSPELPG